MLETVHSIDDNSFCNWVKNRPYWILMSFDLFQVDATNLWEDIIVFDLEQGAYTNVLSHRKHERVQKGQSKLDHLKEKQPLKCS